MQGRVQPLMQPGSRHCFGTAEILAPVQIGTPPKDFPFQLAGYTDVAPEDFV
jgi:hypothetical protein